MEQNLRSLSTDVCSLLVISMVLVALVGACSSAEQAGDVGKGGQSADADRAPRDADVDTGERTQCSDGEWYNAESQGCAGCPALESLYCGSLILEEESEEETTTWIPDEREFEFVVDIGLLQPTEAALLYRVISDEGTGSLDWYEEGMKVDGSQISYQIPESHVPDDGEPHVELAELIITDACGDIFQYGLSRSEWFYFAGSEPQTSGFECSDHYDSRGF